MATGISGVSAISQEFFAAYIIEKLRKENAFIRNAFDESGHVLAGSVVHIPQAGVSPNVVKNRSTFPATAVQRGDSFVTYTLDVFTTDPNFITWAEENEISYDKMDSMLRDHVATLIEIVGDNTLYNWVRGYKWNGTAYVSEIIPSSNIILTSGDSKPVNTEDGQTGNRLAFCYEDLSKVQSKFNKLNVPKDGRYCLTESYMYRQLMDSLSQNQMAAFQQTANLKEGILGRLCGFDIMERSSVLSFNTTNVPNLPGQALDSDDCLGALCYQRDSVAIAKGDIKAFGPSEDPTFYGNVFSSLVKFGGRCRRADWAGLTVIKQATPPPPPIIPG
jgi:hypothetical protein